MSSRTHHIKSSCIHRDGSEQSMRALLLLALSLLMIPSASSQQYMPTHPYFTVPYSINPSFSTKIDYNFNIYDEVSEQFLKIESCKNNIECILETVKQIESADPQYDWIIKQAGKVITKDSSDSSELALWEAYCEGSEQNAVNSLAEAIDACARSARKNCTCSYELPITKTEEASLSAEHFSTGFYGLSKIFDSPAFAQLRSEESLSWEQRTISFMNTAGSITIFTPPPGQANPASVSEVSFQKVAGIPGAPNNITYTRSSYPLIDIYKDNQDRISLYKFRESPTTDDCNPHTKMLKVCVVQNKSFFAYDQNSNKMGIQQSSLKFAYLVKGDVTGVSNFEARNTPLRSGTSLMIWDPVTGADIRSYLIYLSEDPSLEKSLSRASPEKLIPEIRGSFDIVQLDPQNAIRIELPVDSLFMPRCIPEAKICKIEYAIQSPDEDTYVSLSDNTLYYSTIDRKYFYLLTGIEDELHYTYAITAIDTSGKESPEFSIPSVTRQEDSRNDILPGIAEIKSTGIDATGTSILFTINPISYSIDGVLLDPETIEAYRIYCYEQGYKGDYNLSDKTAVTAQDAQILPDGNILLSAALFDIDPACDFTTSVKSAKALIVGARKQGIDYIEYHGTVKNPALSPVFILPQQSS